MTGNAKDQVTTIGVDIGKKRFHLIGLVRAGPPCMIGGAASGLRRQVLFRATCGLERSRMIFQAS